MSKRPHGNKEAKKPKRVLPPVAPHALAGAAAPLAAPAGGHKQPQAKK